MASENTALVPNYGPMVETCAKFGIKREYAFKLQRDGLLQTFLIGRKRYVTIESVRTLPERLAALEAARRDQQTAAA